MEISPEKSETLASLGQDRIRCTIIVDKECLQSEELYKSRL